MTPGFIGRAAALIAWGAVLTGTLSIANWPGNWGHGVCGPWGCGPPLQALWACHLSWLVVLMPAAVIGRRWLSPVNTRRWGNTLIGISILLLIGMILHERLDWWVEASEIQRRYFWNRVGFTLVTQIEIPTLELLLTGIVLRLTYIRSPQGIPVWGETNSPPPETPATTTHF